MTIEVLIEEYILPPLRRGDHFDPSGDLTQDARALGRIYEIPAYWLLEVVLRYCATAEFYSTRMLEDRLLRSRPDASDFELTCFVVNCERALGMYRYMEAR
jgi:hypothetical protein